MASFSVALALLVVSISAVQGMRAVPIKLPKVKMQTRSQLLKTEMKKAIPTVGGERRLENDGPDTATIFGLLDSNADNFISLDEFLSMSQGGGEGEGEGEGSEFDDDAPNFEAIWPADPGATLQEITMVFDQEKIPFSWVDADSNGFITADEFGAMMQAGEPTPWEDNPYITNMMFGQHGLDEASYNELMASDGGGEDEEPSASDLFAMMDLNYDGFLSLDEYLGFMNMMLQGLFGAGEGEGEGEGDQLFDAIRQFWPADPGATLADFTSFNEQGQPPSSWLPAPECTPKPVYVLSTDEVFAGMDNTEIAAMRGDWKADPTNAERVLKRFSDSLQCLGARQN